MKSVTFSGLNLVIDGKEFRMDYPVKEARIINNLAVVIFRDSELSPEFEQFRNCRAYNNAGELIWIAEHPTSQLTDFYMLFADQEQNRLRNFASYSCEIDFATGKLTDVICM